MMEDDFLRIFLKTYAGGKYLSSSGVSPSLQERKSETWFISHKQVYFSHLSNWKGDYFKYHKADEPFRGMKSLPANLWSS